MAFLAWTLGDSGALLFSAFGLFFGIFFVISVIKVAAKKSAFLRSADERISGKPRPVSFVPHRFIMLLIITAGISILAAILIPILFR